VDILNCFRAQRLISSGAVEGLNNKAKITMRKSYGFGTYHVLELALYHSLGKLPEPASTDFWRIEIIGLNRCEL
jgi:transposase